MTLGEKLAIITSTITAASAIFAAGKYVFGFFSPIKLEIELPPVIEFRCSNTSFDAVDCINGQFPNRNHLTVTAALYLRAVGDPNKEATITHATATVSNRARPGEARKLTWLWSGDFVAGQPFQRRQMTVNSLRGGESRSQELWFFPLQEPCGQLNLAQCANGRRNFEPWVAFISNLLATDGTKPLQSTAYDVKFEFAYRQGDEHKTRDIACSVEVTDTLIGMADPTDKSGTGVLYVSAPCLPHS